MSVIGTVCTLAARSAVEPYSYGGNKNYDMLNKSITFYLLQ